jgi:hypothetical protein
MIVYLDNKMLDNLEGGKMVVKDIKKLINASYNKKLSNIDGYELDKDLSDRKVQVYTKNGQAYVIHRGTQGFQDVLTDVKMTFGYKKDKRFKHAKEIQNKAYEKYGPENIHTLAHSLGAKLAEEFGKKGKEIITLNKPTLPEDIIKNKKVNKNQYDIKTKLDPVSILKPFQQDKKDIVIKSETLNPLKEHSSDVLERLPEEMEIGAGMFNFKKLSMKDLKKYIKTISKLKNERVLIGKLKKNELIELLNKLTLN